MLDAVPAASSGHAWQRGLAGRGAHDLARGRRTAAHRGPARRWPWCWCPRRRRAAAGTGDGGRGAAPAAAGRGAGADLGLPVQPPAAARGGGQPGARRQHRGRLGAPTTSPSPWSGPTRTPSLNRNEAYALASCRDCRTVAVAFQVVLVVGSVDVVVPQNLAAAVNYACVRVRDLRARHPARREPARPAERRRRARTWPRSGRSCGVRRADRGGAAGRAPRPADGVRARILDVVRADARASEAEPADTRRTAGPSTAATGRPATADGAVRRPGADVRRRPAGSAGRRPRGSPATGGPAPSGSASAETTSPARREPSPRRPRRRRPTPSG